MNKLIYVWFAVKTVFCTCQSDHRINDFAKVRAHYKISKIGKLSAVVGESSGLAQDPRSSSYWTHNDSGGKAELYQVDANGKLVSTLKIPNASNVDWEDLTKDSKGNIYIGDFGNNSNTRKQLLIYKFSLKDSITGKITFSYTDQKKFPPAANQQNFDCEAFFYHNDSLYLFSKNRSTTNHMVKLYKLPAEPGNYAISPADSIGINTQVTSADISPDGKTFALLTYGKVLIFDVTAKTIDFSKPKGCFRIVKKQAEALIFTNNTDMMATNEQGDIFRITYH